MAKKSKKAVKKTTKTAKTSTKIAKKITDWSRQLGKKEFVALSNIIPEKKFRCRGQEHESTVNGYARKFKAYKNNGDNTKEEEKLDYPFPPVVIWRDENVEDGKYLLVTGFHRYRAAEKEGFDPILAQKFIGTEKEALLFALEDNRHGRKLSSDDLKFAIGKAYREFPNISLQMVAQKLGCDRSYVSRIKNQLLTSQQLTETEATLGVDGRVRKTARKVLEVPTEKSKPSETDELGNALSAFASVAKGIPVKWGKLNMTHKHHFVRAALDDVAEHMEEEKHRIQFVNVVGEWVKSTLAKISPKQDK